MILGFVHVHEVFEIAERQLQRKGQQGLGMSV